MDATNVTGMSGRRQGGGDGLLLQFRRVGYVGVALDLPTPSPGLAGSILGKNRPPRPPSGATGRGLVSGEKADSSTGKRVEGAREGGDCQMVA